MRISDWSSDVCSSDLSEDDRKASIAAVADGTVDVITSSHDPRGPEDKRLPFADAAPGMAGAETLLALSLNLVREGHVTLNRLMTLLSANPARILRSEEQTSELQSLMRTSYAVFCL